MQKNQKQKGTQQFKKSNYKKAIQHYRRYIQSQHFDNTQALLNIALCYFKLQQFERAIETCDQVINIDQKYFKCYYRRAMSRKELINRNPHDQVQKYKFIYDCKMFEKFCNKDEVSKQLPELISLAASKKQQLLPCLPNKLSRFQRDLMQLEKDNIKTFALSWLDQKQANLKQNLRQDKRLKINSLYKQLNSIIKKTKDPEEAKALSQNLKNKIKQLKSELTTQKVKIIQQNIQKQQEKNKKSKQQTSQNQINRPNQSNQVSTQQSKSVTQQVQQPKPPKKPVDDEVKKLQVQKIKAQQDANKQKKLEELSVQMLFKKFFGENLQKTKDVFVQFGNNLIMILTNQSLSKEKKEQLLTKVQKVKKSQLKLLMKGVPKEIKQQLNQVFSKLQIKQQLKKQYMFK